MLSASLSLSRFVYFAPLVAATLLVGCGGDDDNTAQTGPGAAGKSGAAGAAAGGKSGAAGASGGNLAGAAGSSSSKGGAAGATIGGAAGQGGADAAGQGGEGGAGTGGGGAGGAAGQGGADVGGAGGNAGEAGQGGSGDSGAGGSGVAAGAGPDLVIDRSGVRLRGPIVALTRLGRELWIGTNALPDIYEPAVQRAGLHRLSIDSGEVKTWEDELPKYNYGFDGEPPQLGPVATAGVGASGAARLVVTRAGLVQIEASGLLTPKNITVDGAIAVPTHLAIDEPRGVAWLSTNKGLVNIDLTTLAVKDFLTAQSLGGNELGALALDPATGAIFVAVYGENNASRVVRVLGADRKVLVPGENGVNAGNVLHMVFSPKRGKLYVALSSFKPDTGGVVAWDGGTSQGVVDEGDLAKAITGVRAPAFGTKILAIDDADDLLLVGGSLQSSLAGPSKGGGLVFVNLADGRLQGALPGEQVDAIAVDDETRRFYVAARFPCSEFKLRNKGLVALSFRPDGSLRVERPLLSGVRAIAQQANGDVLVGLRDDKPGFGCDGYPIQTGLYRVHANRAGELVPLVSAAPDEAGISIDAGPVTIDRSTDGKFAIGTFGDANFIGTPGGTGVVEAPVSFGVSNQLYAMRFADPKTVWIGGRATHTPSDPPNPDIGPRGAAKLSIDEAGKVTTWKRFTRGSSDPKDVVGLPSGDVRATLVAADGNTYLLCATEASSSNGTDREEGAPFVLAGKKYPGGIARIGKDDAVATVTDSAVTPDPRAGALAPDGRLVVADVQKGLLAITNFAGPGTPVITPILGAEAVPAGAIPTSVWVGNGDDLIVTYDRGVYRNFGGEKIYTARDGYTWSSADKAGVVLVGSEDGLVSLRPKAVTPLAFPAIVKGELPQYLPAPE